MALNSHLILSQWVDFPTSNHYTYYIMCPSIAEKNWALGLLIVC